MTDDQPTFAMAADPLIGRVLDGRFRIVRRLATGGMGRVYVADQVGLDRTVAVKVLWTEGAAPDETFRERFFREARLSSRLTHPNTVRIYDYGRTADDVYYIAMEYLSGATLGELLRNGPLDPLRALGLAGQICASLAEAHGLGLIHRDLKPDNVVVTQHGDGREFVRVLDFGIAKDMRSTDAPTQQGVVFGSPGYMSPEQLTEQPVTPRSDIYSLGAILYRMVTGAKPFGDDPMAALTRQVMSRPKSFAETAPGLPPLPLIEWATMRCLERDPRARFASVAVLSRALAVCELQLRGFLTLDQPPELRDGDFVLPPAAQEVLARFEAGAPPGSTGPVTPGPAVRAEPGGPEPAEPTLPPETRSQPFLELSKRLRHPLVLVLGGLGSVLVVPVGLVLLGGLLVLLQWIGPPADPPDAVEPPVVDPAPAAVAPAGPPAPPPPTELPATEAPATDPPATEAPATDPPDGEDLDALPAPAPAPEPRGGRSAVPRSAPAPVPVPAPPPAATPAADPPAPSDPVPEDPDPIGRSDLRDPFAEPR